MMSDEVEVHMCLNLKSQLKVLIFKSNFERKYVFRICYSFSLVQNLSIILKIYRISDPINIRVIIFTIMLRKSINPSSFYKTGHHVGLESRVIMCS